MLLADMLENNLTQKDTYVADFECKTYKGKSSDTGKETHVRVFQKRLVNFKMA